MALMPGRKEYSAQENHLENTSTLSLRHTVLTPFCQVHTLRAQENKAMSVCLRLIHKHNHVYTFVLITMSTFVILLTLMNGFDYVTVQTVHNEEVLVPKSLM